MAAEKNRWPARAGRRFWELMGGIAYWGECEYSMCATHSTRTKRGRTYAYDYYRCSNHNRYGAEVCANSRRPRANELEPAVWDFVAGLLMKPDLLRAGLKKVREEQRRASRGNPDREAKAWAKTLAEVDSKCNAYQDQQAEGLIALDQLREKLAIL